MSPSRWQQVKQITADALEQDGCDRDAYLRAACAGDESLWADVQRLVAECQKTGNGFLSEIPGEIRSVIDRFGAPGFQTGQKVCGRFEVLRFLANGGMGEVYEAWDSELKEKVALKTIRPEISGDPRIIENFKHEVKQARRISHRNICRVYDLFCHEEAGGRETWLLTMELLAGETLNQHLLRTGPLKCRPALKIVEQLIAGLQAAHELGVVHKDFKPGNVMLSDDPVDGLRVAIMDFGLSATLRGAPVERSFAPAAGTPDYMAPEQKRGEDVGVAADQYALGVVIYEIRTGSLPRRNDHGAFIGPERSKDNLPTLEPAWESTVRRCLEPRPEDRFAAVGEILWRLDPARRRKRTWRAATAGAFILLALLVSFLVMFGNSAGRLQDLKQLTSGADLSEGPNLSRIGGILTYSSDRAESGNLDIWVQQLPAGPARRITTDPAEESDPALSPDGKVVAYRSERAGGGIYLADTETTQERLLVNGGRSPQFSPDGRWIAYWVGDKDPNIASGHLFRIPANGGNQEPIAAGFKDARQPVWSSDGKEILFTGCRDGNQPTQACADWWVFADGRTFNTGALTAVRAQGIWPIGAAGSWQGDTFLFSGMRGSSRGLWEITISREPRRAVGGPRPVTSGEDKEYSPTLASNGTAAFGRITFSLHIWRIENGSQGGVGASKVTDDAEADYSPYVSRNGRWLTFGRLEGNGSSIWVKELSSGKEARVVSSDPLGLSPVVDESGQTVVYEQRKQEIPSILISSARGAARQLCSSCGGPTGWVDGDRVILYSAGLPSKIMTMDTATGVSHQLLEASDSSLGDASWSPENEYLLFTRSTSDGNGKQIFAVKLPKGGMPAGPWIPISEESETAGRPRWSGDGKMIFYLSTRDGHACIWGRRFEASSGKPVGSPFEVKAYHNERFSPNQVTPRSFNLSVAGNLLFLDPAETIETIWTARLKPLSPFFLRRYFPFNIP